MTPRRDLVAIRGERASRTARRRAGIALGNSLADQRGRRYFTGNYSPDSAQARYGRSSDTAVRERLHEFSADLTRALDEGAPLDVIRKQFASGVGEVLGCVLVPVDLPRGT